MEEEEEKEEEASRGGATRGGAHGEEEEKQDEKEEEKKEGEASRGSTSSGTRARPTARRITDGKMPFIMSPWLTGGVSGGLMDGTRVALTSARRADPHAPIVVVVVGGCTS